MLIVEAMAQAAAADLPDQVLTRISDIGFKAPVFPGETATLKLRRIDAETLSATLLRGAKRLTRARLTFGPA